MNKPRYEHDCSCCKFLGTWDEYDLYYHGGTFQTVIARNGFGDTYSSGLGISRTETLKDMGEEDFSVPDLVALRIAYLIAKDLGLVE